MNKLVESLRQKSSKLLRAFKGNSETLEWVSRPDSFGAQLTKLWRALMSDAQQAEAVLQQIQFLLPSNVQGWEDFLLQGGMHELLDLTRYLPAQQQ